MVMIVAEASFDCCCSYSYVLNLHSVYFNDIHLNQICDNNYSRYIISESDLLPGRQIIISRKLNLITSKNDKGYDSLCHITMIAFEFDLTATADIID
jgi:hypothetical protein